jgi:acetoin utilization deacetylase AcuC-like enzyme
MQAGHIHFLELLAEFGVNCHVRNLQSRSALDLAGSSPGTIHLRAELRRVMMTVEPRLRTLVLYHGDCLEHATRKVADWEGPDRLVGIMNRLQDRLEFPEHELEVSSQFDKAAVELLSRVHSPEYIAFVDKLSKKLVMESEGESREINPVAFTPHVQRAMAMSNTSEVKFTEHSDTAFSAGTLRAARRAAGAVAHAVDRVLLGRNKNAFCVVRPPGHHAGYRGLLDGAKSCGFCIFNSVAAGAVHALEGHNCERVAIVDLDIHHG